MSDRPAFTIPQEAMEKAGAKGTDHYADLSDAEREEEGLPPRDAAPAEKEPAGEKPPSDSPGTKKDPEPEPKDGAEEEEDEAGDDLTGKLFEEIEGLREDLSGLMKKPEPKTEKQEDELLAAALEHDDPIIRGLAERLKSAEDRLGEIQEAADQEVIARQIAKDDADFDAVQKSYTIGGKPMTDQQIEAVEKYILDNPEAGKILSIEEAALRVFPSAVKKTEKPTPARGKTPGGEGPPAATIITEGASGGAPTEAWKPRPNESIESAVKAGGERLFGVKR